MTRTVTIALDGEVVWEGDLKPGEVLFDGLRRFDASTDWFHIVRPKSPRGRKKMYSDAEHAAKKHSYWKKYYRLNREVLCAKAKAKRAEERSKKK